MTDDEATESLVLTYPPWLNYRPVHWVWRKLFCPQDWHLYDQVIGWLGPGEWEVYLYCDACERVVHLAGAETITELAPPVLPQPRLVPELKSDD